MHFLFKRQQNLFHFIRFFDGADTVKQYLRLFKLFFHHAQPLFQTGNWIFVVGFFGKAQVEELDYP